MQEQQMTHRPHIKAGRSAHVVNVESQTRPGVFYSVNVQEHTCSCPAGKHGRRLCWHIGVAMQYAAWRAQVRSAYQQPQQSPTLRVARPTGMAALQEAFA